MDAVEVADRQRAMRRKAGMAQAAKDAHGARLSAPAVRARPGRGKPHGASPPPAPQLR
jgi:hypothetical protein